VASVNKVMLIGNLGADPEMSYLPSGDAVCNLRLATTEKWKDKASGEAREISEWHSVVLFRGLAEIANRYLKKGAAVYIEGRLKTRKWHDKNGQDRYSTEIEAGEMRMLGSSQAGASKSGNPRLATIEASPTPEPRKAPVAIRADDPEEEFPF